MGLHLAKSDCSVPRNSIFLAIIGLFIKDH
nr:MAG TPA: hypothetical protein [Caudoviricetes sp.]